MRVELELCIFLQATAFSLYRFEMYTIAILPATMIRFISFPRLSKSSEWALGQLN